MMLILFNLHPVSILRVFLSLINKATRFPHFDTMNASILDHIWTNFFNVSSCGIFDYDVNDHRPTFCIYNFPNLSEKNSKIKIVTRPFSESNMKRLSDALESTDWNDIIIHDNPDSSIVSFFDKLNHLYVKFFPLKIKYVSEKRLKNKWITQDIKKTDQFEI